jgi:poly(3-hydroxybutyrate) depolymerase
LFNRGFFMFFNSFRKSLDNFCAFLIILLLSCVCYGATVINSGAGNFVFDYKTPSGKINKIPVYYFCPEKLTDISKVVFVLHGAGRDGKGYRDEWQPHANKLNFLVLCPEFSEADFPGWGDYNGGKIYDYQKKKYTNKDEWTFNVIESLFDFVKQDRALKAEAYCLFGHSAGAQFVHRMVLFMPEARFSLAIANGAGDYTLPVFDKVFSDGLKETCVTEESLVKSFNKEMIIMMGAKDIVSQTMPKEGHFDQYDRVWKARIFFQSAREEAKKRSLILKWKFTLVPNVDHNHSIYAQIASNLVAKSRIYLSNPNAKDANDVNSIATNAE